MSSDDTAPIMEVSEEDGIDTVMEEEEESGLDPDGTSVGDDDMGDAGSDPGDGGDAGSDPGEEHEFEIIDQVESDEEGKDDGGEEREEDDMSSDSDQFDDSELHDMLEKGIDKESISAKRLEEPADGAPLIKHKIVLQELESDPFDILPPGWVCVTHNCGMPVYLHRESRVCTMARPYSLGSASTRTHDIPISAIPCLQYRRQLDKLSATVVSESQEGQTEPPTGSTESTPVSNATPTLSSEDPKVWRMSNGSFAKCPISESQQTTTEGKCPVVVSEESQYQMQQTKFLVFSENRVITQTTSCPVITQESDIGGLDGAPRQALHTGRTHPGPTLMAVGKNEGEKYDVLINRPSSPGGENIAVKTNSSSVLESESTQFCVNNETEGREHFKIGDVAIVTGKEVSKESAADLAEHTDKASNRNFVALQFSTPCEESCRSLSPENICAKTSTSNETVSVTDTANQVISATVAEGGLIISAQGLQSSAISQSEATESETAVDVTDKDCGQESSHVVKEEVSSSSEPSAIVPSGDNTLASIKRKLESLKSRQLAKQRRLESGGAGSSATGWPTDHNLPVNGLKYTGPEDTPEARHTAKETLKAHAAEVKIKTAEERAKENLLNADSLHLYCGKLFKFKTIEVKKYRSWRERRKHIGEKIRRSRPELPSSTKLITCPIIGGMKPDSSNPNWKKREFVLNPTGKSYLCILHEYMQRTLKIQPTYVFKELENSKTPYGATVTINNIEYGTGYASSKKVAKQEAAKETLKILIPDLFNKISDQEIKRNVADLSFFDEIKVTDPRVNELGNKVGQPSPFQLLLECLRRNFGMGNTQCNVSTQPLKNQKCEFSIQVGKHSATVVAKNKRDGKQLAAQAILAKLHPHVPSWGSLLRLYGTNMEKPQEKVEEMNEIKSHVPNHSVLESLREEMRKLHKQKEAIQSKGKMIISSKDLPSKMSGVDL